MSDKQSFVFYRSFYEALSSLPDEVKGRLFDAICNYALNGAEPDFEGVEKALFTLMRPQLDANAKRYENGRKGGRPATNKDDKKTKTKPNSNQNKTKPEPNVNVNANVKEKKQTKKESYWWSLEVIKLVRSDYEAWFQRFPGNDDQFTDWLKNRDEWYREQPPHVQKNWFLATSAAIEKCKEAA